MKLPMGTGGDVVIDPKKKGILKYLMGLTGALIIESDDGSGFILLRKGDMIAAYYKDQIGVFRGTPALHNLMAAPAQNAAHPPTVALRKYTDETFAEVLNLCTQKQLLLEPASLEMSIAPPVASSRVTHRPAPAFLDEATLTKIIRQPGVIAVSAFYEGFPVQSLGNADFEHIAARAEDLLRAGTRIAQDMNIGRLDQLILETEVNKIIIAPCGDLFLCIIAHADAQLGLLRVLVRSIQSDAGGGA
ncbi:MAG TPA: roadblock/LC7 domain-containing protein [Methanoregula sp.]|nr:roadblock/LC7 domain-containing protein [Methanoregula sp.]